ncbi:MAG: hypothetical protein ACYCSQ_05260 [bacterium]
MNINLTEILGAIAESFVQQLALYIPDKDKDGKQIDDIDKWIEEAQTILTAIGGGTTSYPLADGTWLNPENNKIVSERTKIIYTYIIPDKFECNLEPLRVFLHKFGRETNQGEVVFEFDGIFYKIRNYDK